MLRPPVEVATAKLPLLKIELNCLRVTISGLLPHRLDASPRVRTIMRLFQTPIRLYSYPTSPYTQKVGCYLNNKKLDYELVGVNPKTTAEIA